MIIRKNIAFNSQGNILRGWLYSPENNSLQKFPAVIMSHGFSALKEHFLDKFAEKFVSSGMIVLIYDQPNFGESEGEPRQEVNPALQISAYQDAISYLETLSEIDHSRIGIWGTSFSGGHVLVVAAQDKRVKSVVAQVPFINGPETVQRARAARARQSSSLSSSTKKQSDIKLDMIQVVRKNPDQPAIMPQESAYQFFTSISHWQNCVTWQSVNFANHYEPEKYLSLIENKPVLFIVADSDDINAADITLNAYEKLSGPKKLIIIKGDHFAPYEQEFENVSREACEWFKDAL